ncbi:MAG: hypothetical protein GX094_02820 [Clostridiales bacterium]|nr:hypothetical protein [Clostridiales bacterium]
MKRKLFATVLLMVLMFVFASPAYAIQLPLELSRRRVSLTQADNITLVSFHVNLRVRIGFTSVNTSMVIRNDGLSETNLLIGVPSQLDSVVTVKQSSVIIEGKTQKLTVLRSAPNSESTDTFMPPTWSTLSIKLGPGESKVIESSYTMDNKIGEIGQQTVYFPLSMLNFWEIPIKYLQVVADLDFYPPYVFEPNPSLLPLKYEGGGRLLWQLTDVKEPQDLVIYFTPVEACVANYLNQEANNNREIKNIVALYQNKDYDTVIDEITNYLTENPDTELKTELEYVKALCHLALYQPGMALDIFDRIENNPGFNNHSQLSNIVRNKIIYDKVFLLGLKGDDQEVLEYLKQIQPTVKNNVIFSDWIKEEIVRLTPPPPENEPTETPSVPEQPETEEEQQPATDTGKAVEYVQLFGYDVPVELLFIGFIVLIIIIYIIRSSRRRRRNKYLF